MVKKKDMTCAFKHWSNYCYYFVLEFAFLVDQRGRFIRSSTRIDWEGAPDSFALSYPYILAFEPDFIEIRNVHTVSLCTQR